VATKGWWSVQSCMAEDPYAKCGSDFAGWWQRTLGPE